jgi:uncharacterized protein
VNPVPIRVPLGVVGDVSALLQVPPSPRAAFVFAHGAGAGMTHPFMAAFAAALTSLGVATLRFNFPSRTALPAGRTRPPLPRLPCVPRWTKRGAGCPAFLYFAGGKSFGGRMSSQAQAQAPLPEVRGLVFVGFPLHPAGKPSVERAAHLARVDCPMLFLQGTRDALAEAALVAGVVHSLGVRATLVPVADADHAFHVRVRSGTDDAAALQSMAETAAAWMDRVLAG